VRPRISLVHRGVRRQAGQRAGLIPTLAAPAAPPRLLLEMVADRVWRLFLEERARWRERLGRWG